MGCLARRQRKSEPKKKGAALLPGCKFSRSQILGIRASGDAVDVLSDLRRRSPPQRVGDWGAQSLHCLRPVYPRVEFVRIRRRSARTTGGEDKPPPNPPAAAVPSFDRLSSISLFEASFAHSTLFGRSKRVMKNWGRGGAPAMKERDLPDGF